MMATDVTAGGGQIGDLNVILASIKTLASESSEQGGVSKEQWDAFSSLVLRAKAKNRELYAEQVSKRSVVDAARNKVDNQKLRLENLLYKKQYLLREIQIQSNIDTPCLDKIEAETGRKITVDTSKDIKRSHKRSISSLDEEKNLRIEAKSKLGDILNNVKRINEVGAKKKKFLDSIPMQAEVFAESLKDLQSKFKQEMAPPSVSLDPPSPLPESPVASITGTGGISYSSINPASTLHTSNKAPTTIPLAPSLTLPL